jgi:hypothetical protein
MSKKIFNPKDWATAAPAQSPYRPFVLIQANDIETITNRIEAATTDIAPNYADWRDLGFAIADALGESGRSYYHRLSCFYPKYSQTETDKQFDNCLKSHGHGVTIKTLYHLAKTAGVDIAIFPNCQNGNFSKNQKNTRKIQIIFNVPKSSAENTGNLVENTELLQENTEKTPTFPEIIYSNLPAFCSK